MNENNKILFLINTEYTLLMSLLYYLNYHADNGSYPVFVILNSNPNRFKNINLNNLPGEYYCFTNELSSIKLKPNRDFLKVLDFESINEIAFQNPNLFVNQIIINGIKNREPNCLLTLISDSVAIDRKLFTRRTLLKQYSLLFFRKIFNKYKFLSNSIWTYTSIPYNIDSLIAHRNIGIDNFYHTDNLLKSIPNNLQLLFAIFNFDVKEFSKCDIIFFTQPILNYSSIAKIHKEKYLSILKLCSDLSIKNKKRVILKIHPGENEGFYLKYENEYIKIIRNTLNIPAEIIINSIYNKKVVSISSSISAYDVHDQNQHFWLYKLLSFPNIITSKSTIILIDNILELEEKLFKN